MQSTSDFTKILKEFQTITNSTFSKEFQLKGLEKNVFVKELNINQQKKFLNFVVEERKKQNDSIKLCEADFLELNYQVIKENIVSGMNEDEIKNLTIYERILFSLILRSLASEEITVSYTEKQSEKETQKIKNINLKEVIESFETNFPNILKNKTLQIKTENSEVLFTVDLKLPTIEEEIEIERALFNTSINSNEEYAEILIHEILKYVKSIATQNLVVKLKDLSIDEKITLINSLPIHVANPIISEINTIKERMFAPLSVAWKDSNNGNVYYNIIINSEWFLNY